MRQIQWETGRYNPAFSSCARLPLIRSMPLYGQRACPRRWDKETLQDRKIWEAYNLPLPQKSAHRPIFFAIFPQWT